MDKANSFAGLFEQAAEYKSQLNEMSASARKAAVDGIRDGIAIFGWDVDEIIVEITATEAPKPVNASPVTKAETKAKAKPSAASKKPNGEGKPVFILVSDPSKTYSGKGRKPDWMLEALEDAGINPKDKDAYLSWRDSNMKLVGSAQPGA